MTRIIVTGAKGRMGSRICALIKESVDLALAAGIDAGDSLEKTLSSGADVVIDFTVAAAAAENASIAAAARVPIVIGTTGMDDVQNATIAEASRIIPIVQSSNMSIGVNVMWKIIEQASRALGDSCAIDIEETHHVHKLDRPSGTAKTMAERALLGRGNPAQIVSLVENERWARKAGDNSISVRSFRREEVVGDHTIRFACCDETLSISHHAESRDIFARGALAAARWIAGKPSGIYTMTDVLGLR